MLHHELSIEVESTCISLWKEPWAKRSARVTLFVDFEDQIVIVKDTSNGFWFLPGGGVEENESVEEAAKREALEELGLEVNVDRIVATYNVTLALRKTREHLKIPPFVVVHATCVGGRLKKNYAPKRQILLVRKDECDSLLRDSEVPEDYEWMKPYFCVSREAVREFLGR